MLTTCRNLYHTGTPHILAHGVELNGRPSNMESFNSFMLWDGATRCSFLRKLSLKVPTGWCEIKFDETYQYESEVRSNFNEVIMNCSNLSHLELLGGQNWLTMERRWGFTLASLSNLEHVDVSGNGQLTEDLLQFWANGLKWVCVSFVANDMDRDPRQLVYHLHDLKRLHVKF